MSVVAKAGHGDLGRYFSTANGQASSKPRPGSPARRPRLNS